MDDVEPEEEQPFQELPADEGEVTPEEGSEGPKLSGAEGGSPTSGTYAPAPTSALEALAGAQLQPAQSGPPPVATRPPPGLFEDAEETPSALLQLCEEDEEDWAEEWLDAVGEPWQGFTDDPGELDAHGEHEEQEDPDELELHRLIDPGLDQDDEEEELEEEQEEPEEEQEEPEEEEEEMEEEDMEEEEEEEMIEEREQEDMEDQEEEEQEHQQEELEEGPLEGYLIGEPEEGPEEPEDCEREAHVELELEPDEQEGEAEPQEADEPRFLEPAAAREPPGLEDEGPPPVHIAARAPPGLCGDEERQSEAALLAAPTGLDGEELELEALQAAAEARAAGTQPLVRDLGEAAAGVPGEDAGPEAGRLSALPGVATNALFICYADASGTAVHVVAQATMAHVASVSSGGARVVDLALQAEDSHLLTAFDDGRVIVFRLSTDSAAARVLLKFEGPPAQAVLWHPANPRVFLTLHAQRALLWHLQQIAQFSTVRLAGYEPLEEEGVQTALQVTAALMENATSEALPQVPQAGGPGAGAKRSHEPPHGASAPGLEGLGPAGRAEALVEEAGGPLQRATFSSDGQYLMANTERVIWLWRLTSKDQQTPPRAACLQRHELPEGLHGSITHMRLVPRYHPDGSTCYIFMAVTAREVLFWNLDTRPSGGTGYWLPYGRLLCPVQQRLRFPWRVSADIFLPWGSEGWPRATLVAALEPDEAEADSPLLLAGELAGGEGRAPVVPSLAVLRLPPLPGRGGCRRLACLRAFERSTRAKALPEGAEAPAWAVAALALGHGAFARCLCLALPRQPALTPVTAEPAASVAAPWLVPEPEEKPEEREAAEPAATPSPAALAAVSWLSPEPPEPPPVQAAEPAATPSPTASAAVSWLSPEPPEQPPVPVAASAEPAAALAEAAAKWLAPEPPEAEAEATEPAGPSPPEAEAAAPWLAPEPSEPPAELGAAKPAPFLPPEPLEPPPARAGERAASAVPPLPPEPREPPPAPPAPDAGGAAPDLGGEVPAHSGAARVLPPGLGAPPAPAAERQARPQPPPGLEAVPAVAGRAEADSSASPPAEPEPDADPEANGQGRGARGPKRIEAKDTDPLTPHMVRYLARFMEKRAGMANQALLESISRRIPGRVSGQGGHGSHSRRRGSSREPGPAKEAIQLLIKESSQMVEQLFRAEKHGTQSLKKLSDPEAVKLVANSKPFKDMMEKEVAKWRDSSLFKAVLKAAEGKPFADHFADGLKGNAPEAAALMEALQPTRQQLQEALQADLKDWCTSVVAKRTKGMVQDIGLPQAHGAMDAALREVSAQTSQALDRTLQEVRTKADAKRLLEVCAADVSASVQREVQKWEAELAERMAPAAAAQGGLKAMREGFARRMRDAVAPLQRDLDSAARDLQHAGEALGRCREHARGVEAALAVSSGASSSRGPGLAEDREAVFSSLASGRIREAFERALSWDAQNKGSTTSLVELTCRRLQSSQPGEDGEELTAPEELLVRPEVAAEMDSRLKLLLTFALLQRAVLDDTPMDRIEVNLEWAFGLLQAIDTDAEGDKGLPAAIEAVQPGALAALEQLRRGERPAALAEASVAKRREVTNMARLALKSLDVLARLRPRA